jgi:hypothetical protein
MNAVVPSLSDDAGPATWAAAPMRSAALAAGRARMASGDWPPALAVADAILAELAFQRCRRLGWTP